MSTDKARWSYRVAKRTADVVAASVGLVILSPILAGVAIAVRAKLGRPVLFRQQRPGRDGRPFMLLKFRSMLEIDQFKGRVTDADRLTSFGRTLRATSLDELPTLWNVLRGDMSVVGPRPLLMEYLERYSPEQAQRHRVRPGITGLAQVRGRNELPWEDRFRLDVQYVEIQSLALDLRILVETVRSVLAREGISHSGHVTMPPFEAAQRTETS